MQPETLRRSLESGKAPVYEDEYEPKSTITAFEEFLKSSVWRDMKDFLISWRERARSLLEETTSVDTIYRLQGEAVAYGQLALLPEAILEQMKQLKEQTNGSGKRDYTRTTV